MREFSALSHRLGDRRDFSDLRNNRAEFSETCMLGSARGAIRIGRPYRDWRPLATAHLCCHPELLEPAFESREHEGWKEELPVSCRQSLSNGRQVCIGDNLSSSESVLS